MDNAHKEFQKAIGAAVCRYVPERGVLLAISRHENIHRHSSMLQEMHFRNLSQKVNLFLLILNKIPHIQRVSKKLFLRHLKLRISYIFINF